MSEEEKTSSSAIGECVIQHDPERKMMRKIMRGPAIPIPELVHFLELLKLELLLQEMAMAQQAQQQAAQKQIVVPNGPMPNFRG